MDDHKEHIPYFDPSEYWAGSLNVGCHFFFPAIECWELPDLETRTDTHTHTLWCIMSNISYQLTGLPKLSWVIYSTSFWVGKLVNIRVPKQAVVLTLSWASTANMWRSIIVHFCCSMWSHALCDDGVLTVSTVLCTTYWCMMPVSV